MSFSSLEADPDYMRSFDSVELNATDYANIETIKKDTAKVELKRDILSFWNLESSTDQSTALDSIVSQFTPDFERALAKLQLYYIYFELGGEFGTKHYERTKEFKRMYEEEKSSWVNLEPTSYPRASFKSVLRG